MEHVLPRRSALLLLAGFGLVLAGAIALGELLTLAERPRGATPFDASITTWVVTHRSDVLTPIARVLSVLGSQAVLAPLTLILAAVLAWRKHWAAAARLLVAWAGATVLYTLTKLSVQRMRPPRDIWLTHVGSTSFPSGHATQSLATFVALAIIGALWLPRARWTLGPIAVAVAIGVAWSRVYLGVHWTTDVLAGGLIAAAWVWIVVRLIAPAAASEPAGSDGVTDLRPD